MNQTTQTDTPLANALRKELCLPASTDDKAIALIVRLERALVKANADKTVLVEALIKIDNTANASIPTAKKLARISEQARTALSQVQA